MKEPAIILIALGAAILWACGGDDYAVFEANNPNDLSECMAEQFPFEPTFLAAQTYNDRTALHLQTVADTNSFHDAVVFNIYDPDAIEPGEVLELQQASAPPAGVRGKMVFFSSCPFGHDTLTLEGTVRFDEFGTQSGSIIAGEFVDMRAIDARSGETKLESLSGSWSFEVRHGPPYEDFYAVPERP